MSTKRQIRASRVTELIYGLLRFALLITILLGIFYTINRYLFNRYQYKLKPDTKTLICGSSLVGCGINPDQLRQATNIAQGGELYSMSLIKLKSILNRDHNLKYVILPLSPGMFSKKTEKIFLDEPLFQKAIIERLHPISSPEDYKEWGIKDKVLWQNFFQFYALPNWTYYKIALAGGKSKRKKSLYPYIGKFRVVDTTRLEQTKEQVLERMRILSPEEGKISETQLNALRAIINLASSQDVELILAGIPIYPESYALNPRHLLDDYFLLRDSLATHSGVHIFDLSEHKLADSMFYDASHLNLKGARFMTDTLRRWLDEQEFYTKNDGEE